ncbi:FecCD family ABC transporter permease [Aureimonas pseudogalii]|uniref:Iron complex transport system permease protein n=1 Tax=Aureimonas pseudogalii TaxID=1744844 RepID=A0A7W6H946_9HYPH|nr:iron ABC transporter permease [Aureimonas pseudogalii]MBB4000706.1 iron complex transport system permease protein [Aureimonas pseudogalii]
MRPANDPAANRRAPAWLLPVFLALAVTAPLLAVLFGVADLPVSDVAAVLTGHGDPEARSIILDIRLPRIVTGMMAGVHFAVAGLLLQTVTRNPLADPSLIGVSQGATLAVTLFLMIAVYSHDPGSNTVVDMPTAWMPAVGTLGGLAAGGVIYLMAFRLELGPLRLTLCGIAVGALLQSLALGLVAGWGSTRVEVLLEWLSGSLYARRWEHALFLAPFTLAGLAILPLIRRPVELLRFDGVVARSFGLSYRRQFSLVLVLSCTLAASAVGVVGPIVFVGLIVPHLARALARGESRLVLPLTIALGASVVTLCDLVGRLIGQADEIPIGVVTAICGVPVLIVLLRRTP